MSQTIAGYLFKCKVCEKTHFMSSGKPHDGIILPCIDSKYSANTYKKDDFVFYSGWDCGISAICIDKV